MSYFLDLDFSLCLIYYDELSYLIFKSLFYFTFSFRHLMIKKKGHQTNFQLQFSYFKNFNFVIDLKKFTKLSLINTFNYSLPINYLMSKDFDFKCLTFDYRFNDEKTNF